MLQAINRVKDFLLHPLGFFYLRSTSEEGISRVHVWLPNSYPNPDNDRHTHSFSLHSTVLAGRMLNELFTFEEAPTGPDTEYEVSYSNNASKLQATGRKGLLLVKVRFETSPGSMYYLEAGVIHRATVLERPCVTIVETVERSKKILTYGNEDEPPFTRRPCSAAEAEQIKACLEGILPRT